MAAKRANLQLIRFHLAVCSSTSPLRPIYGAGCLQIAHGLYFAAASFSGIGIALLRKVLQPARWYFVPVLMT